MFTKKISDDDILALHAEGLMQKTIAERLQTTPGCISKRISKLLKPVPAKFSAPKALPVKPEPEPLKVLPPVETPLKQIQAALSEKEKIFVAELVESNGDASFTEAAQKAYPLATAGSAKTLGSRMAAKPAVRAALAELLIEEIPLELIVSRLCAVIQGRDPMAALKAINEVGKLLSLYPDPPVHKSVNVSVGVDLDPFDLSGYGRARFQHPEPEQGE